MAGAQSVSNKIVGIKLRTHNIIPLARTTASVFLYSLRSSVNLRLTSSESWAAPLLISGLSIPDTTNKPTPIAQNTNIIAGPVVFSLKRIGKINDMIIRVTPKAIMYVPRIEALIKWSISASS